MLQLLFLLYFRKIISPSFYYYFFNLTFMIPESLRSSEGKRAEYIQQMVVLWNGNNRALSWHINIFININGYMAGPIKRAQDLFLQIRFCWTSDNWSEICLEEQLRQTTTEKVFKTVKTQKWLFVKVMFYGYSPTKMEELESVPTAWNLLECFDTMEVLC